MGDVILNYPRPGEQHVGAVAAYPHQALWKANSVYTAQATQLDMIRNMRRPSITTRAERQYWEAQQVKQTAALDFIRRQDARRLRYVADEQRAAIGLPPAFTDHEIFRFTK